MNHFIKLIFYPSLILLGVQALYTPANAEEIAQVSYTQAEKDFMVQLAMCEDGANYTDSDNDGLIDGMVAIQQSVKNYCITYSKTIWQAVGDLHLSLYQRQFNNEEYENSLAAFEAVWNEGSSVTDENIIWWVTPERYETSFHATQKYVGQFGSHIFVAPHEP